MDKLLKDAVAVVKRGFSDTTYTVPGVFKVTKDGGDIVIRLFGKAN